MAESVESTQVETSTVDRAMNKLVELSKPPVKAQQGFIPNMSDEAQRPVMDPFVREYEPNYWTNLAAAERVRRSRSWESTVYY